MLAWEHFHPGEPLPLLLDYVQDRDLWRWELPESREVSAWLTIVPREMPIWDMEIRTFQEFQAHRNRVYQLGSAILAAQRQHVESLASKAHWVEIAVHRVPEVNSPIWQSELGERLCQLHPDAPFAAVFFALDQEQEVWSLRSRDGFDVSTVAKAMGGGGHPAAAGFKAKRRGLA